MKRLSNGVKKVIKYFSIFGYKPTLDELYTFLPIKIDKKKLKYTPPQYSIGKIKDQRSKIKISQKKLNNWRFKTYIKILSLVPQIKLIGLSGSISMMNAKEEDDIDLFIITAKNRLFTGRLIALALAQILGLRRSREEVGEFFSLSTGAPKGRDSRVIKNNRDSSKVSKNKVCLNLFFDERNLKTPKFKQTIFVGHEVLQMKPIINKSFTYEKFLFANLWVTSLFPNSKKIFSRLNRDSIFNEKSKIKNKKFSDWLEYRLKRFQMNSINKHKTTEIITSTQLWFHPDDFEKKIGLK